MRVALYARVSTIDKDQNPETQMRLLREHAARLGWEVAGEYVDTVSAVDYSHRVAWRNVLAATDYGLHQQGAITHGARHRARMRAVGAHPPYLAAGIR